MFNKAKSKGMTAVNNPWLWVKESDRESYFELTLQGNVASSSHQAQAPWIEDPLQQVISFNREEDLEIRGEPRESDVAMQKRIMADVGVKIVSWVQHLKSDETKESFSLSSLKNLSRLFLSAPNQVSQITEVAPKLSPGIVQGAWMYASSQDRMKSIPTQAKVWSGVSLVRYMLAQAFKDSDVPEAPFVTGVVFSGDPTTVIVFLKCEQNGQFSMQQVVRLADLTQDAFDSACTDFAEQARLGRGLPQERIKLFDGAHLLGLMVASQGGVRPYPAEAEFFRVGQSTWLRFAMYVSVVGLALDLVWGLGALGMATSAKTDNQQLEQAVQAKTQIKKIDLDKRFGTLVQHGSLPLTRLIDEARSMYRDGIRLEIDASRAQTTYRVSRRFADEASQPAAMAELLRTSTPENCVRSAPETTLQLNEVFVHVQCKTVDPYLARVLGAGA